MQIKIDSYYLNVLIKGLYSQRLQYDNETNEIIDTLLLRLVDKSEKLKPKRKLKICFESKELSVIRKSLIDWRNQEIQAGNEVAVEVISETLVIFI